MGVPRHGKFVKLAQREAVRVIAAICVVHEVRMTPLVSFILYSEHRFRNTPQPYVDQRES
jgi:hypothetical protein